MVALFKGVGRAHRPSFTLLLVLFVMLVAQISVAQDATTDDTTTTTTSVSSTTESTTTSSSSSSSSSSKSTTTSSSKSGSTTSASTTSTSTDTSSTSTSASSSSSTDGYPVVTVPPTADAPYMQKSNIPEGTLFIAVGAVLGAIGLAILAWRGIVAWSVNRSVRQAAMTRSSESKGLLRSKRRKSRTRRSSSAGPGVALDKLGGAGTHQHHRHSHHSHHSHRQHRASKGPSANSGLFFSPTAGMQHGSGTRRSSYLPAGYYNANNVGNNPRTQDARYSAADLTGLGGPQAQGYIPTRSGSSPPESPGLPQYHDQQDTPPRRNARRSHVEASTSTLSLASPPTGRTPSAYLEDLFDSHPPQNRE